MAKINNDKVQEVQEKIEEIVKDAKEISEPVVEETVKAVRKTRKKATETTKKATDAAKKTAAKTAGKLTLNETYIQFAGFEYKESDIIDAVQESFKSQGHRISTIKSMQLYVKPEEKTAYYVINDKFTGSVLLVDVKAEA